MGRLFLVGRLVLGDLRRHPAAAVIMVVSIAVAAAMLSLGISLHGASERLYRQTREATAGPDVISLAEGGGADTTRALKALADDPWVAGTSPVHSQYFTEITVRGITARTVVVGADQKPGEIDRPLVTAGTWLRPGSVVLERGYAAALGAGVGDEVTVGRKTYPVAGIALTAARMPYPHAQMGALMGDPDAGRAGLLWMNQADTRPLAKAGVPVGQFVYLRLTDPAAGQAFMDTYHERLNAAGNGDVPLNSFPWQAMIQQGKILLEGSQPILMVGGWLLALLAVIGMTTLTAGRAAQQVRRVGLLKAVGATPGVILAVLLLEHVSLALLADVVGLGVARLLAPELVRPSESFLTTGAGPTEHAVVLTTLAALLAGVLTTLGPTLRALRTETVEALNAGGRPPTYHPWLTSVTALLPVGAMLGIRLIARRPGRAVLHAFGTAGTAVALAALAMVYARPMENWNLGRATLTDLMDTQVRQVTLGIAVALIVVAVINTLTITWTTAAEARATMAVAQALGATPGQITAGLSAAQLLPTLPGAVAGVPVGIGLYFLLGPQHVVMPPLWWLAGIPVVILAVTAALTAVPARLSTTRPIADTLSRETT